MATVLTPTILNPPSNSDSVLYGISLILLAAFIFHLVLYGWYRKAVKFSDQLNPKRREKKLEKNPLAFTIEQMCSHRDLHSFASIVADAIMQMIRLRYSPKHVKRVLIAVGLDKQSAVNYAPRSDEFILYSLVFGAIREYYKSGVGLSEMLDWSNMYYGTVMSDIYSLRNDTLLPVPLRVTQKGEVVSVGDERATEFA